MKQVDKKHYMFNKYVDKNRWISLWHQLDEVASLDAKTVLEIGPGPGLFKSLSSYLGIHVDTLDIDPDLKPDYVGSAAELPITDHTYDCVCAFQILEHLPYEQALKAFKEMVRVSKKNIIISLPDSKDIWQSILHIPLIGKKIIRIPQPVKPKIHKFDGEHYWEINKSGYSLRKITQDLLLNNVELSKTYRVEEFIYHRFFVFYKK